MAYRTALLALLHRAWHRLPLLLLLAALHGAPSAEASTPRASALERDAPASAPLGAGAVAALAVPEPESGFALFVGDELARAQAEDLRPGARAPRLTLAVDVEDFASEPTGSPAARTSRAHDATFHPLQGLALLDAEPPRGPPELGADPCQGTEPCTAETRIRAFEAFGQTVVGIERGVSLELHWGSARFSLGLASVVRSDPWGLSAWSSIQGYVAGITEEADPTGLLPQVEALDAGYRTGSRDAEDFDLSKTAGKWTLRGLTALKAGLQKGAKLSVGFVKDQLRSRARSYVVGVVAGEAGDLAEDAAKAFGADEATANVIGKIVQRGAAQGVSAAAAGPIKPVRRKTYQTYTKTNVESGEAYGGRTSGFGTPEQNVARRDRRHDELNSRGFGPAVLDKSSPNRPAIRGREEKLIGALGGPKSRGGTAANKIGGVSPDNPRRDEYLKAAEKEFPE